MENTVVHSSLLKERNHEHPPPFNIPSVPIFFKVLGLLEGKTVADIREQLDQDYKNTMLANWGVFVPAAVVNLAFCPPELRVLFLNVRQADTRLVR